MLSDKRQTVLFSSKVKRIVFSQSHSVWSVVIVFGRFELTGRDLGAFAPCHCDHIHKHIRTPNGHRFIGEIDIETNEKKKNNRVWLWLLLIDFIWNTLWHSIRGHFYTFQRLGQLANDAMMCFAFVSVSTSVLTSEPNQRLLYLLFEHISIHKLKCSCPETNSAETNAATSISP